jgi:hypothetical protein
MGKRSSSSPNGLNLVAVGLGLAGVFMLWQDTNLWLGLGLTVAGSLLYDGLPTRRQVEAVVKTSPVSLLLGAGVGIFYFRYFGTSSALESIMGAVFAVLIVQQFILKGYERLVKK